MFVHGDNLQQKESSTVKYTDAESKKYLSEIRLKYDNWKNENLKLKGPFDIVEENDNEVIYRKKTFFLP